VWKWILRTFFGWAVRPIRPPEGGTECHIDIVDNWGRIVSKIYYTKPDSNALIEYTYVMHECLSDKKELEKIAKSPNKGVAFFNEIVANKNIPFAKRIFVRCEGYVDDKRMKVDDLERDIQIDYLVKYWVHHLIAMNNVAYQDRYKVKKND